MINVSNISKNYGSKQVLEQINFTVEDGESFGIIGPNGSGKSTLLKLLSGIESSTNGEILLDGKSIRNYSRKDIAKWLAVLQQESLPLIGFTVREVIEMGRFPYQTWLGNDEEDIESLIDSVIEKMNLTKLSERRLEQLSGGERQRVALAKTMAQAPKLLMLDEPTTYLDIGHQVQLMDTIIEWKRAEQMTVLSVLHDLNLASLYCDRLLLLNEGKIIAIGSPEEIIREDYIEQVYGVRPNIIKHPNTNLPQIILDSEHAKLSAMNL